MKLSVSHYLAITLPVAITFWLISVLYSSKEIPQLPSPLRWLLSIGVPIVIAVQAYRKNSLDLSGCAFALIMGMVVTLSNYCFTIAILTFFITSSKATHIRKERKRELQRHFEEDSRRNWLQVICNGGVATQVALFYLLEEGPGETAIDFTSRYNLSWWCISFLGAICCANGDTWASELGSVFSSGDPLLITSLKPVPRGTNGGVSFIGLVVSSLGGLVVSFTFVVTEWFCVETHQWRSSPPQLAPLLLIGLISGFLGSLIDSLLGATLQYSGLEARTGKVVEYEGPGIWHISGRPLLDNHSVNLFSNLITALISPPIAIKLWTYF